MVITESYIKENLPYSINNQHKNYFVEQTEASAGGALWCHYGFFSIE